MIQRAGLRARESKAGKMEDSETKMNCQLDRDMRNMLLRMRLKTHLKYVLENILLNKERRVPLSIHSSHVVKHLLHKGLFFSLLGCM